MTRLRSRITRFVADAQTEPGLLTEVASVTSFRDALADCVKDYLFVGAAISKRRTGRPKVMDAKMLALAVELIEDSSGTTLTVPELAAALDVSERAVPTAFQRNLGVSPRKYVELCRLHRARRKLRTGFLPDTTVTKVAAEVGMWNFGRFAARYRCLFGEQPSGTLARRRN